MGPCAASLTEVRGVERQCDPVTQWFRTRALQSVGLSLTLLFAPSVKFMPSLLDLLKLGFSHQQNGDNGSIFIEL